GRGDLATVEEHPGVAGGRARLDRALGVDRSSDGRPLAPGAPRFERARLGRAHAAPTGEDRLAHAGRALLLREQERRRAEVVAVAVAAADGGEAPPALDDQVILEIEHVAERSLGVAE